jgi:hypothetical protein
MGLTSVALAINPYRPKWFTIWADKINKNSQHEGGSNEALLLANSLARSTALNFSKSIY